LTLGQPAIKPEPLTNMDLGLKYHTWSKTKQVRFNI